MTFSIIQKSQLEGADRIDAEYYQSEYIESNRTLSALHLSELNKLCKVTDGNHMSISSYFQDFGVRYLRGKDLQDFFISDSDPVYIPEDRYRKLERSYIYKNDVLLSIVGTVGMISVVSDGFDKLTGSCKIAILHPQKIDPQFLAAFLSSKYGQNQLQRKVAGAVQTGIILQDLENVLVPTFTIQDQESVSKIVQDSYDTQVLSEKLYKDSENLLLQELGLLDFKPKEDLSYIVDYSDVEQSGRVDADYFQPKYEELISKLQNGGIKNLLDIIQNVPSNFIPKFDENYKYIELANINSSLGIIDGYSEILGKDAPSRAKRVLKENDVIVSSIQGSLEKVALVQKENDGNLASNGFFQFRSNQILPEVLLVLAKSIVLQWQLERECVGTILSAVPQDSLKRIVIPVLPKATQQKIADLVKKSHEARKKSKELLEEAKRKVEEMIERGNLNNFQ